MSITVLADANIPALEHYLGPEIMLRRFEGRGLLPDALKGVDALMVRSVTRVDSNLLQGTGVKFVGTATSGHEHVDRHALSTAGVHFAYAPGSNANSVVEYVLAAIAQDGDRLETLIDGSRVGVIGYGYVGRKLVQRLEAMGINYCCFDPWLDQAIVPHAAELSDVLLCEVISVHCELTEHLPWPSRHLIGQRELRYMSSDSLLINASRGPVIDNIALSRALAEGAAPSTVLDVWEYEPDVSADLLQRVLIGTPHVAGYSLDGKVLATAMLCEALSEALEVTRPRRDSPLTAPPPVQVNGATGTNLMRRLIQAGYDIYRDDALLRGAVLGASRVEVRENFDGLRRNYAERRELLGREVLASQITQEDRKIIHMLGAQCVDSSAPG